jgi:hypothetical protein
MERVLAVEVVVLVEVVLLVVGDDVFVILEGTLVVDDDNVVETLDVVVPDEIQMRS